MDTTIQWLEDSGYDVINSASWGTYAENEFDFKDRLYIDFTDGNPTNY